jgi:hypothetical protein
VGREEMMSTYKVEVFDPDQNDYVINSWHKNKDYAIIQAEVQETSGKKVRIIHEGKIVYRN